MAARMLLVVLVATSIGLGNAAKYDTCNSGVSTLTMVNYDKQPANCREGTVLSLTNFCLMSITVKVAGCNVTETSNVTAVPGGFPCNAPIFLGNLTAANAVTMLATISPEPAVRQSVAAFCITNAAACASLVSYDGVPTFLWREEDIVYLAASENCTYTYKISENSKFLDASGTTPVGVSKTSTRSASLATSPAAQTSPAPAAATPAPKASGSSHVASYAQSLLLLVSAALLLALSL